MTPTITDNERSLLVAIRDNEFQDGRNPVNNPVWVNCIYEWDGKPAYGGVMASLVKKGLAETDGETCSITQKGFDAVATIVVVFENSSGVELAREVAPDGREAARVAMQMIADCGGELRPGDVIRFL
jgi:hypothetical protein